MPNTSKYCTQPHPIIILLYIQNAVSLGENISFTSNERKANLHDNQLSAIYKFCSFDM